MGYPKYNSNNAGLIKQQECSDMDTTQTNCIPEPNTKKINNITWPIHQAFVAVRSVLNLMLLK